MELKNYQKAVIRDLERYLEILMQTKNIETAYTRLWQEKDVKVGFGGMPKYQNLLPGVPNVCLKVPTGGGKTFLAANAIEPIFSALGVVKRRAVVWLVPSDAILTQTLAALRDPAHPYRQKIDVAFGSRVEVYTKEQLLMGQHFNISAVNEQLSIMVLSYDSFRGKKERLKAKQENSSLVALANALGEPDMPLEDTDPTALMQVINQLHPLVIVDESHHARSNPSKQMLQNFNPCFVLDLTATPTKESNIISIVDAIHLKRENMVKLPVIVMNRNSQQDVLHDAIEMQRTLEIHAKDAYEKGGSYIRPIVLFQAQPKSTENATTFEKLRQRLIAANIPAEQIAIKTAEINELKNVDLLSEKCSIRFIITVNALKEGWDCPFAYILASLANRTSQVDVEQIVGRILRLPYTRKHSSPILNTSYVLTSSADFKRTLDGIVKGLNNAGFTDHDYRVQEEAAPVEPLPKVEQTIFPAQPTNEGMPTASAEEEEFFDFDPTLLGSTLAKASVSPSVQNIFDRSEKEQNDFDVAMQQHQNDPLSDLPLEVQDKVDTSHVNPEFLEDVHTLKLPKFCLKVQPSLFSLYDSEELSKENLLSNFTLKGKPSAIDFGHLDDDLAQVDLEDRDTTTPRISKLKDDYQQYMNRQFPLLPGEDKLRICKDIIHKSLCKMNAVDDNELRRYVDGIVDNMNREELDALERMPVNFAAKIRAYVMQLQEETARENFYKWLETEKIVCEPRFQLTEYITLPDSTSSMSKSLYQTEGKMDGLEYKMALAMTNMDNIRWWHRNPERNKFSFCLNGFRNHYPDFIVRTTSGKIILIETKGDQLENAESREKIRLGRAWQDAAGKQAYRYYMVFQNKDLQMEGAYRFDEFLTLLRAL